MTCIIIENYRFQLIHFSIALCPITDVSTLTGANTRFARINLLAIARKHFARYRSLVIQFINHKATNKKNKNKLKGKLKTKLKTN